MLLYPPEIRRQPCASPVQVLVLPVNAGESTDSTVKAAGEAIVAVGVSVMVGILVSVAVDVMVGVNVMVGVDVTVGDRVAV